MNRSNAITVFVVVASAVIPYLLSQQDVVVPPIAKVILTAANIGLLAFARLSGTTPIPVAEDGSPAQTPAGNPAVVTETDGK